MEKMLQYMTWQEAKEAFKSTKMAIIPTGATEQHGPHLPLGTDFLIADYLAKKVAEKIDVVVTPVIPVGYSYHHTGFEGTLSVNPEVFSSYCQGIVDSLISYGITHILFINGHGQNLEALGNVCRNLRIRGITAAYLQWWHIAGKLNKDWEKIVHHGEILETSLILLISPDSVKLDRALVPTNKKLTSKIKVINATTCEFNAGSVGFYLMTKDINADDIVPPAGASIEKGKEVAKAMVDYIVDFTEEFKKIKFEPTKL